MTAIRTKKLARTIVPILCVWCWTVIAAAGWAQAVSGSVNVGEHGQQLHYEMQGSGEPVVLIHGLSLDRRMWDEQFEALSAQYRVIRYDTVGHGLSSGLSAVPNGSVRQWDHLRDLLDALQINKAHVVGLSMGGTISLDFALTYPERVQTITSIDGVLGGYPLPNTPGELLSRIIDYTNLSRDEGLQEALEAWIQDPIFAPAIANPEVKAQLEAMILNGHGSLGADAHFQAPNNQKIVSLSPPANNRLPEIDHPSLIFVGELDDKEFHNQAARMDDLIPNSSKLVVPAAGHMANMEDPQFVNAALFDFLSSHPIIVQPGDTNGDLVVDLVDLNNVRNNFGGRGLGDATNDIVVDLEDLNAVRNNFGAAGRSVPEPSSMALIAVCIPLVMRRAFKPSRDGTSE